MENNFFAIDRDNGIDLDDLSYWFVQTDKDFRRFIVFVTKAGNKLAWKPDDGKSIWTVLRRLSALVEHSTDDIKRIIEKGG